MTTRDRRAHRRYPAWFPIGVRVDGEPTARPAMLCDVSEGGALVWGFWQDPSVESVVLEIAFAASDFELAAELVSIERQWDTVIMHLRFKDEVAGDVRLAELITELRAHFDAYQSYLARRADDDPALGRTSTQYPGLSA